MTPRVSLTGMVRAGVPHAIALSLRTEAATVDELRRQGRITREAGLRYIVRLAARLAGERP